MALVDIVEGIAGIKLKRSYNLGAPKGVKGRNSDNTLISKYLGWEPNTKLRDGLERPISGFTTRSPMPNKRSPWSIFPYQTGIQYPRLKP